MKNSINHSSTSSALRWPLVLLIFLIVRCLFATPAAAQGSLGQTIGNAAINANDTHAPQFNTRLFPRQASNDTVVCTLSACLPQQKDEPVRIILTCSRQPDLTPPTISIDGWKLEKQSESSAYQMKDGVESHEYVYQYKFFPESNSVFTCQVEGLAFDGIGYDNSLRFSARKSGIYQKGFASQWPFFLLLIGCYLIGRILFRLRFRREGEVDFAPFILRNKRLPLSTDWATTHYGFPAMMFYLSACMFCIIIQQHVIEGYRSGLDFFLWFFFITLLLGLITWHLQTRKLRFQEIRTTLGKKDIFDAIAAAGTNYKWSLDHAGDDCIVCHTNPSFGSLTWGEQIFIVFDQGCVWVNSVNDLDKRSTLASFGYTKRNIRRVAAAILNKEKEDKSKK